MITMSIEGAGVLSCHGRGIDSFRNALKSGSGGTAVLSENSRPAYRVPQDAIVDRNALQAARRADRFSRMAVLAAYDAVKDSGADPASFKGSSTGVIVSTAFGAHSTIFNFLDDIIDYDESKVSPITFAHSIHNAAASYIAATLQCCGPVVSTTQFHFSFHQALMLSQAWLTEKRVEKVLIGHVDECSPAMEYIFETRKGSQKSGKAAGLPPGEGSVFFLLSQNKDRKKYGAVQSVTTQSGSALDRADLILAGSNSLSGMDPLLRQKLDACPVFADYSSIYGGILTPGAFECLTAGVLLADQKVYPCRTMPDKSPPLNTIQCLASDDAGHIASFQLTT